MECRKVYLENKYGAEMVHALTDGEIPCPVCFVVHSDKGDRPIRIIKEEKKDAN